MTIKNNLFKSFLYLVIVVISLLITHFRFKPMYKWGYSNEIWNKVTQFLSNDFSVILLASYVLFTILSRLLRIPHPLVLASVFTPLYFLALGILTYVILPFGDNSDYFLGYGITLFIYVLIALLANFLPHSSKKNLIVMRSLWIAVPLLVLVICPIQSLFLKQIGIHNRDKLATRIYDETYIESRKLIVNCTSIEENYGTITELDLMRASPYFTSMQSNPVRDKNKRKRYFYAFKVETQNNSGLIYTHGKSGQLELMTLGSKYSKYPLACD